MKDSDFIQVDESSVDVAIEILVEAFKDDPLVNWVSTDSDYPRFLFSTLMPFYLKHGLVLIDKNRTAALMALLPGQENYNPPLFLIIKIIRKLGFVALFKILRYSNVVEKLRCDKPHYYLLAVGTTAKARKTGAGGSILKYLASLAAKNNVLIYGENTNPPENNVVYNKLGYSSADPVKPTNDSPSFVPIYYYPKKSP